MTDQETFSEVPVVGHHVTADIEDPDGPLCDALDEAAVRLDIERRDTRHVKITRRDLAWDEPQTMKIPIETFESLCRWFQQTTDDE